MKVSKHTYPMLCSIKKDKNPEFVMSKKVSVYTLEHTLSF